MKIGLTGLIVVTMVLAMMPSASAFVATIAGQVEFANGTPVTGVWDDVIRGENLNQSYPQQPWTGYHYGDGGYIIWDYALGGQAEDNSEYIRVWVNSPDMQWYGETTARLSDVYDAVWDHYIYDIVLYEQPCFSKPMPEGWNLISPPITPADNSVSAVLSTVTQNAVKLYNATSKQFEDATTMDPGIGYFVHVTNASTWQYCGTSSADSTSTNLKSGLNMIGVPNCAMDVSAAMGSADYRYVARWNAAEQEYEVYNPSAPSAFHGFTEMAAGEGYFVSAQADDYILDINCPP